MWGVVEGGLISKLVNEVSQDYFKQYYDAILEMIISSWPSFNSFLVLFQDYNIVGD